MMRATNAKEGNSFERNFCSKGINENDFYQEAFSHCCCTMSSFLQYVRKKKIFACRGE